MNHPGGSYLLAILAIVSTGLSLDHDPQRPASAHAATSYAARTDVGVRAGPELDVIGEPGGRLEGLAMRGQQQARTSLLRRTDMASGADPDLAASCEATLPPFEFHMQIIHDLRWQGAHAP